MSDHARPTLLLTIFITAVLGLAGCSDDPDLAQPGLADATQPATGFPEAGEAQPGLGGELVDGDFGGVPLPTAAQPFGEATVEDDVTVQSFEVQATSPQQVIDFYREELPALGWESASGDTGPTSAGGIEQVQLTFTRDGETLLVSAADLDGLDAQLSLQLSGSGG